MDDERFGLTGWDELSDAELAYLLAPLDDDELNVDDANALLDGLQENQRDEARIAANRFESVDRFRKHRLGSPSAHRDRSGMFPRALRAELAAALGIAERTAEALMARAERLVGCLPATLEGLRAGRFTERHATIIADESAGLCEADIAVFEAQVLPLAERMRATLFERRARRIRELLHPEELEQRHEDALLGRHFGVEPGRDGMGWLTAHMTNENLVAIENKATAIARSLKVDGETRTLAQLKVDVLADILLDEGRLLPPGESEKELRTPVTHRGIQAEVSLLVPVLSATGRSVEPGTLEGGIPIDAATAARLAGTATGFTRILTHPETGIALSFGKTRYQVPPELKRYLRYRDETCRFVGCDRKARFCDLDHTIPWAGDGLTEHDNLAHECPSHHKVKDAGWQVTQARDGTATLTWQSPLGRVYTTEALRPLGGNVTAQTAWLNDAAGGSGDAPPF